MKWIGIFSILIFLLVREINSFKLRLCFHEKYYKYKDIFIKAYKKMVDTPTELEFSFYRMMDEYVNNFQKEKCDIAMIEPALYDEHYTSILDINEHIKYIIESRITNDSEGEIYAELIKDLRADNKREDQTIEVTPRALPLFMDYGILYYRSENKPTPPTTWEELAKIKEILPILEAKNSDTLYIGQFSEYREFYYNLIENVLNTDEISNKYKTIEKETSYTINQFKELFNEEIIDEYAWHLNSEYGVIRFNDKKAIYMRNWSSYLYNVTTEFNKNNNNKKFSISKILYSEARSKGSRAINKGIYLCIPNSIGKGDENRVEKTIAAISVIKTFTEKEFMKLLIEEEIFYDIPAYSSLLQEDIGINNKEYCDRINCSFFRELQKTHIVAAYDVLFQHNFLNKFTNFYENVKSFLKEKGNEDDDSMSSEKDTITLPALMSLFSKYFQDNTSNATPRNIKYFSGILLFIILTIKLVLI